MNSEIGRNQTRVAYDPGENYAMRFFRWKPCPNASEPGTEQFSRRVCSASGNRRADGRRSRASGSKNAKTVDE